MSYGFVLRAAVHLGRLPRPGEPDPGTLGYRIHDAAITLTLLLALALALGTTVIAARCLLLGQGMALRRRVALVALVWTLVIALSLWDPGGLLDWLWD